MTVGVTFYLLLLLIQEIVCFIPALPSPMEKPEGTCCFKEINPFYI